MRFKDFYNVITEGFFQLPRKVFQEILDYYNDARKKVKAENIKRITTKSFPPKIFKIDLTGTNFEFLQKAGLKTEVKVYLNLGDQSFYRYSRFLPQIHLSLNDKHRGPVDVVEHEMLHFIQYLIGDYKKYKNSKIRYKDIDSQIGGLPSQKFLPKDIDIQGYIKDTEHKFKNRKRVEHTKRPVEYYPDLLSSIRSLQFQYEIIQSSAAGKKLSKKDFFRNFIEKVSKIKNTEQAESSSMAIRMFYNMKRYNPDVYRLYLKYGYIAFVENDSELNSNQITHMEEEIDNIEKERKKKEEEKNTKKETSKGFIEKVFDSIKPLKIDYYNRSDFSNLEDENYYFSEDVFERIPHTRRRVSSQGEYYFISLKYKHLRNIFTKIRNLKDKEDKPVLKANYDYFAKKLIEEISEERFRYFRFSEEQKDEVKKALNHLLEIVTKS